MFENLFDELPLKPQTALSYDEWLAEFSKGLRTHPMAEAVRAGLKVVQFVFAREKAFLSILAEKGVWSDTDSEKLENRTVNESKNFDKELLRSFVRAASGGNLKIPMVGGGEITVTPDAAIAALNAFVFDHDEAGADAARIFVELIGKSESDLKKQYDEYVRQIEVENALNAKLNEIRQKAEEIIGGMSRDQGSADTTTAGSAEGSTNE